MLLPKLLSLDLVNILTTIRVFNMSLLSTTLMSHPLKGSIQAIFLPLLLSHFFSILKDWVWQKCWIAFEHSLIKPVGWLHHVQYMMLFIAQPGFLEQEWGHGNGSSSTHFPQWITSTIFASQLSDLTLYWSSAEDSIPKGGCLHRTNNNDCIHLGPRSPLFTHDRKLLDQIGAFGSWLVLIFRGIRFPWQN